jgi:hypothetical protein
VSGTLPCGSRLSEVQVSVPPAAPVAKALTVEAATAREPVDLPGLAQEAPGAAILGTTVLVVGHGLE